MNKSSKPFSVSQRIKSFSFAINGLKILFRTEHNARIHLIAAVLVVLMSIYFNLSAIEWVIVLFCISMVFVAELFNSSIEYLADAVSTEKNKKIGAAKDLGAAAVLVSAIFSVVVGLIVFTPKFLELI